MKDRTHPIDDDNPIDAEEVVGEPEEKVTELSLQIGEYTYPVKLEEELPPLAWEMRYHNPPWPKEFVGRELPPKVLGDGDLHSPTHVFETGRLERLVREEPLRIEEVFGGPCYLCRHWTPDEEQDITAQAVTITDPSTGPAINHLMFHWGRCSCFGNMETQGGRWNNDGCFHAKPIEGDESERSEPG